MPIHACQPLTVGTCPDPALGRCGPPYVCMPTLEARDLLILRVARRVLLLAVVRWGGEADGPPLGVGSLLCPRL